MELTDYDKKILDLFDTGYSLDIEKLLKIIPNISDINCGPNHIILNDTLYYILNPLRYVNINHKTAIKRIISFGKKTFTAGGIKYINVDTEHDFKDTNYPPSIILYNIESADYVEDDKIISYMEKYKDYKIVSNLIIRNTEVIFNNKIIDVQIIDYLIDEMISRFSVIFIEDRILKKFFSMKKRKPNIFIEKIFYKLYMLGHIESLSGEK